MRVVEGSDLGGSVELLDQSFNLGWVGVTASSEGFQLSFKLVLLAELAEHLSEVDTLLTGNLGSWGVLRSGTVTDGVGALGAEKRKVVVHNETSSLSLGVRKLVHQVSGDLSGSVTGSPDQETVRNVLDLLVGILDSDAGGSDILDHGSSENVNLVGSELVLGVLNELFGEGGQDVGECFNEGDLESVGDFRVPLFQVILDDQPRRNCETRHAHNQEIVELSGVLDTGWSTTDNDHVHQSVNLSLGLIFESGSLDT